MIEETRPPARKLLVIFCALSFLVAYTSFGASEVPSRDYQVAERGGDYKVMQSIRSLTNSAGQITSVTNRYTILGNGMNRKDASGNWVECVPVVQAFSAGVICTGASYRVILNNNLNRQGSVDIELDNGERFTSHPLALAFLDPDTGRREWIGQIKDCRAKVSSNAVVYTDAFAGIGDGRAIEASVVYTYNAGRFHQDVVFTKLPTISPATLGMGSRTRLEVVTEIIQKPAITKKSRILKGEKNPVIRGQMAEPDVVDETLVFTERMRMPLGYAFSTDSSRTNRQQRLPVAKRLRTMAENRTVLVESVEWKDVQAELGKLPRFASQSTRSPAERLLAQDTPVHPPGDQPNSPFTSRLRDVSASGTLEIARLDVREPQGFIMDYSFLVSGSYNYYSGGTYYIDSEVDFTGITDISGGVFKFSRGNNGDWPTITIHDWIDRFEGVVCTSMDDDTVGEIIDGSTSAPIASSPFSLVFLYASFYHPLQISNSDIRFAASPAIQFLGNNQTFELWSCSLRNLNAGSGFGGVALYGSGNRLNFYWLSTCGINGPIAVDYGVDNSILDVSESSPAECDDFDGDGLSDSWERQYFGALYYNGASDPDGDGYKNDEERQAGSNPNSAASTPVDKDADGLPDTWEFAHFGDLNQPGSGDYDGDGVSDLDEFTAGTDPNTTQFDVNVAYGYVATLSPTGTVTVLNGVPYEMAIKVDTDDLSAPTWQPFNVAPILSLSDTDGEHQVWVAVRGRVPSSEIVWQKCVVTLDRVAPTVTISSPSTGTTGKPFVQVTGTASEPLSVVQCLVNNSSGWTTNNGFVTGQSGQTVSIKCFDVDLTNGVNLLRVEVADRAGNLAHSDVEVTLDLDGDTVAPALTLLWPQDGQKIGSDVFTLRGTVDDETATVQLIAHGTSGQEMEYSGNVERNGKVWVDDVALESGENMITLRATDAKGNFTETSITVERSTVDLTINTPSDSELLQATVTLTGTVSDSSYAVWVNGNQAEMENGNWSINVPVSPGGYATFSAAAVPPDGGTSGTGNGASSNPSGPNILDSEINPNKESETKLTHGEWEVHREIRDLGFRVFYDYKWNWDEAEGGYAEYTTGEGYNGVVYWTEGYKYWVDASGAESFKHWVDDPSNVTSTEPFDLSIFWPGFDIKGPRANGEWEKITFNSSGDYSAWSEAARNVKIVLHTGGREGVKRKNLFSTTGSAERKISGGWRDIPKPQIKVPYFGNLGADGYAYAVLPDNEPFLITPTAPARYYKFDVQPSKHKLNIQANGVDLFTAVPEFCVGQRVTFTRTWNSSPVNVQSEYCKWVFSGPYKNDFIQPLYPVGDHHEPGSKNYFVNYDLLTNLSTYAWWYNQASVRVQIGISLTFANGKSIIVTSEGRLSVYRPSLMNFDPKTPFHNDLVTNSSVVIQVGDALGRGKMDFDIGIRSKYSGFADITQLINAEYGSGIIQRTTFGHYYLDNYEFYTGKTDAWFQVFSSLPYPTIVNLNDSPGRSCLLSPTWYDLSFRSYVRFRPSVGNLDDNIYVTLGIITWEAAATAIRDNQGGGWEISDIVTPSVAQPDNADEFPFWRYTFRN